MPINAARPNNVSRPPAPLVSTPRNAPASPTAPTQRGAPTTPAAPAPAPRSAEALAPAATPHHADALGPSPKQTAALGSSPSGAAASAPPTANINDALSSELQQKSQGAKSAPPLLRLDTSAKTLGQSGQEPSTGAHSAASTRKGLPLSRAPMYQKPAGDSSPTSPTTPAELLSPNTLSNSLPHPVMTAHRSHGARSSSGSLVSESGSVQEVDSERTRNWHPSPSASAMVDQIVGKGGKVPNAQFIQYTSQGSYRPFGDGVCNAMVADWISHGYRNLDKPAAASRSFGRDLNARPDVLVHNQNAIDTQLARVRDLSSGVQRDIDKHYRRYGEGAPMSKEQLTQLNKDQRQAVRIMDRVDEQLAGGLNHQRLDVEGDTISPQRFSHQIYGNMADRRGELKDGFYRLSMKPEGGGSGHTVGMEVGYLPRQPGESHPSKYYKFMDPNTAEFIADNKADMLDMLQVHADGLGYNRRYSTYELHRYTPPPPPSP